MKTFLGIDLGSTTSKAVITDDRGNILGKGITNTRANYEVAAEIAREEAEFNTRFSLLGQKMSAGGSSKAKWAKFFTSLEARFQYLQYKIRHDLLLEAMRENLSHVAAGSKIGPHLAAIGASVEATISKNYLDGSVAANSQFFRDLFSGAYIRAIADYDQHLFDHFMALFDRSITPVENRSIRFNFSDLTRDALDRMPDEFEELVRLVSPVLKEVDEIDLSPTDYIGTGYGRQLLPFDEIHIKSEILCHAMGAHACFPNTRTVLDIGGQDTKAIQVDKDGLVTSFQMNDRCAAGCGRYLGYIADEMSITVSELGPIAMEADHESNICSTCTVFAGAELREYLNLGEKKENILAGLHKAIVQRAFALVARSGGVRNEFTFTGGVARNEAVVKYVSQMIKQTYGEVVINIHPDSIFMGALGAALFSQKRSANLVKADA